MGPWDTVVNVRFGGYTEGIDRFDGACFGVKRGEALLLDPQQRSLLEGVLEAGDVSLSTRPSRLTQSRRRRLM